MDETLILNVSDLIQDIEHELVSINDRIGNFKQDAVAMNKIIESKKAIRETFIRNEKLHSSFDSLLEWFNIRDNIKKYETANKQFNTTWLTQKQSEAFKAIVQKEYVETFERFAQELKTPNVKLKLNAQKGKTLRGKYVATEEYKVTDIMSEGEQKAIAMAEFATDLTMRKNKSTVLFDDPVTSMDYKRSELMAKLIYQLSLDRQILVFTHNIMFYYFLYNACKSPKNDENKFFRVDEYDKLNKGIITESFSGKLETLKEITNKLKNQRQIINSNAFIGDEQEETLKKAYGDIRTWCELIIEEGFFNSVIRRYEPNIMFMKVKGIKGEFVKELDNVYEIFERSSRWMSGHSQPIETQNTKASREAFNKDMDYVISVYEHFRPN